MILFTLPALFGLGFEVHVTLFVLGINHYFFFRWPGTAAIKVDAVTRQGVIWIFTIAATPILYVTLVLFFFKAISYTPNLDFEAELWATQTAKRFQMAEDLIDSEILLGKDTTQVKALLGEPDHYGRCVWKKDAVNTWAYSMGVSDGGFGFLLHQLALRFDQDNVTQTDHVKLKD